MLWQANRFLLEGVVEGTRKTGFFLNYKLLTGKTSINQVVS